jgi:hypothetical protein
MSWIAWSPFDCSLLLTAGDDGDVSLWTIGGRDLVHRCLATHPKPARTVVFHPVLDWIAASGCQAGVLMVHDVKEGRMLAQVQAHANHIYAIAFSRKNPLLIVTSGKDTAIRLWSLDPVAMKPVLASNFSEPWLRPVPGLNEFVRLFERMSGKKAATEYPASSQVHVNDLIRLNHSRVKQMTGNQSHEPNILKQMMRNKAGMKSAARLELLAGNVKRYCELMFAAGEYEKALAAAPAVSFAFWQNFRKESLRLCESPTSLANSQLLLGNTHEAVKILLETGEFEQAFLVAAAKLRPPAVRSVELSLPPAEPRKYVNRRFLSTMELSEYEIASISARAFVKSDRLLRAASAFLSIGDVDNAFHLLLNNGEFVFAFLLAQAFHIENLRVYEIWLRLSESSPENRAIVPENLLSKFDTAKEALNRLDFLKREIVKPIWDFCECRRICRDLEMISDEHSGIVQEVRAISLYLAGFEAVWKGYRPIWRLLRKSCNALTFEWLKPLVAKQNVMEQIVGSTGVIINPINNSVFGPTVHLDKATSVTRKVALMWADVTSFAPTTETQIIVL